MKIFQNMFESLNFIQIEKQQIWHITKFHWSYCSKIRVESNRNIVSFFKVSIPKLKLNSSGRNNYQKSPLNQK